MNQVEKLKLTVAAITFDFGTLLAHKVRTDNPHATTAAQVGAAELNHSHPEYLRRHALQSTDIDSVLKSIVGASQLLYGSGVPAPAMGEDGSYYLDTDSQTLYGPRTSGEWLTVGSLAVIAAAGRLPRSLGQHAAPGVSRYGAAEDHVHPLPTAEEVGAAPADHSHTLPTAEEVGAAPADHGHTVATPTAPGFLSAADKAKLDNMAAGANAYTHPDHSGDVTSTGDGATVIASNAVTVAKMQQVGANTVLGRASAGTGSVEVLAPAAARGVLGLGDAATKNVGTTAGTVAAGNHTHTLDATQITSGVLDLARLPAAALERLVPVANQTARYALTTATVQLGDTVRQLDTGTMYVVVDTANLHNATGYQEYTAGSAAAVPWSGVTGKPTTLAGYGISDAQPYNANIQAHIGTTGNPHGTTAAQVGAMPTSHAANAITGFGGTPSALGSAWAGNAVTVARSDHVHPLPSAAQVGAIATSHAANAITGFGSTPTALGSANAGSATTVARSDHVHPLPSAAQVGAAAVSHSHPEYLTAANVGTTAGTVAAGDHTHPAYAGSSASTAWFPSTLSASFTDSQGGVWLASGHVIHVDLAPLADPTVWGAGTILGAQMVGIRAQTDVGALRCYLRIA